MFPIAKRLGDRIEADDILVEGGAFFKVDNVKGDMVDGGFGLSAGLLHK
jgi:hypothetical protein